VPWSGATVLPKARPCRRKGITDPHGLAKRETVAPEPPPVDQESGDPMMHTRMMLLAAAAAGLLAGCCLKPAEPIIQQDKIDLAECIARHNANAELVEHLWIHCGLDLNVHRPGQLPLKVGLDGLLIYRTPKDHSVPPRELILKADLLGNTQMLLGSNDTEYWMWSQQQDTIYVGTWQRLGQPGTAVLPVGPAEVFWMLGVCPIKGTPILSYTRDDRYRYVRFYDVLGPRQLRVLRELQFDRIDHWMKCEKTWPAVEKDRLVAVRTWAPDGTPMVEAAVGDYQRVVSGGQEILLPTVLTIHALTEDMTLRITLSRAELAEALTHEVKDAYFIRRPAPVKWKVLLDEGGKRVPNE